VAFADDYVVFGTVPWDTPWLTEQNLAHALARRRRVLYVEPPITPLTPIRYGVGARTIVEARRVLASGLREADGVHVLQPVTAPPLEHPRVRAAAAPLVRAQVRRAAARLGMRQPVLLAARSATAYLGAVGERLSVYVVKDLVEAGASLIGKDGSQVWAEQRRMLARVDLVCAVTRRLQETLAERGVRAELLPHGFHAELAPLYDGAPLPPEYASLPRPLLGYTGRIDGRLDFAALARLADRHHDGSVVLVGPVSPRLATAELEVAASRPNVHLLGARDREDLPAYVRHLDCCLMPYRSDPWLLHASPLKLWDYLYAGPPVAGSGCAALLDHPLVEYTPTPEELPAVVEAALASDPAARELRRAYALRNTWEHRALELEALLDARMAHAA
jgi:teichuronic acid biosynthesis glycosyltransferase TuaH